MSKLKEQNINEIIYLFIKNKNKYLYGREIAKKINKPQKTIQNLLNELFLENILEKIQSGKNFNFKLNLSFISIREILLISEIYKVKKIKKNFEISQIINYFIENLDVPILIFGSYAKNYSNEESDLDILILNNKKINIKKIQSKVTIKINIIYLSIEEFEKNLKEENDFVKEVLRNHIIINNFEYFIKNWRKINEKN